MHDLAIQVPGRNPFRGGSGAAPAKARRGASALMLCCLFLPAAGCQVLDSVLTSTFMPSPEQEIEFGVEVAREIEKGLVFVEDPEIVEYIRRLGRIIVSNSPQQAVVPTTFYVVKNGEINAFAIPGGNIYVHTGLIEASADEAELASVLGHEFGHVVYRHGMEHAARAQGYGAMQQIFLGQEAGGIATLAAGMLTKGVLLNYSRSDELEADSLAIPTLYAANYDPAGMVTFFETLKERYGETSGGIGTLFASHPPTTDRIERVRQAIATLPPKAELYRPVNDLRRIQARMDQLGLTADE